MTIPTTLQVAQVVSPTEAEGPGARMALWVQGCPLRCPGCCNPLMLPREGGHSLSIESLVDRVRRERDSIEGLSFLGGEPTEQAAALAMLARRARGLGLTVMLYTGFTLDQLRARDDAEVTSLLDETDLVVDGPYIREQPDDERRWIGSRNQGLHFLTDRYRANDPRFRGSETIEIRLSGHGLTVNGWPAPADALRRGLLANIRGGHRA